LTLAARLAEREPEEGSSGGAPGEVDELLLPPGLSPETARPLAGGRTLRLGGATMGTDWSLQAVVPRDHGTFGDGRVRAALERVFAVVIAQMSQWEPRSQISRFNRAAAGEAVAIGPQFAIVLDCALNFARATGGAFDPALGAASEAWGFGAAPAPASLPLADRSRLDWRALRWSPGEAALVQPGGVALDLSGIAKGFAVDMGIAALERLGIRHALLEIGGELRGIGLRADGLPWWVDCEQVPAAHTPSARVGLSGWAIATSGDYRRRRSAEGRSWSHTLDPQSGRPLDNGVRAVSVLHRSCMQADALATALTVLGPERGLAFADAHGIPARMITADAALTSAAWRRWLG